MLIANQLRKDGGTYMAVIRSTLKQAGVLQSYASSVANRLWERKPGKTTAKPT
jgi:hypothetical protein